MGGTCLLMVKHGGGYGAGKPLTMYPLATPLPFASARHPTSCSAPVHFWVGRARRLAQRPALPGRSQHSVQLPQSHRRLCSMQSGPTKLHQAVAVVSVSLAAIVAAAAALLSPPRAFTHPAICHAFTQHITRRPPPSSGVSHSQTSRICSGRPRSCRTRSKSVSQQTGSMGARVIGSHPGPLLLFSPGIWGVSAG
jgi:hypothetical protein